MFIINIYIFKKLTRLLKIHSICMRFAYWEILFYLWDFVFQILFVFFFSFLFLCMWERERERETTNIQIVEAFRELARDLRTKNKIKCIILEEKTETKPKLREKIRGIQTRCSCCCCCQSNSTVNSSAFFV